MDWEWISGREGEELDGWFPEEDELPVEFRYDTDRREDDIPDEVKAYWDDVEWYEEEYADNLDKILGKMGLFPKDYNDCEYYEKRTEIASEIMELLKEEVRDCSDDNAIKRTMEELEKYYLLEDELTKRDFEHIITKYIERNGEMCNINTIEDVLSKCSSRSYLRSKCVYPVMLRTMVSEYEHNPENVSPVIENEIMSYLETTIDNYDSDERIKEAIEKLERYRVFEIVNKSLFRLELQKELKKSAVNKNETLEDIIDLCDEVRTSNLYKYLYRDWSFSPMSAVISFLNEDELGDAISVITEDPLYRMTEDEVRELLYKISESSILCLRCGYDNDRVEEAYKVLEEKIKNYLQNPGEIEDKTVGDVIDEVFST